MPIAGWKNRFPADTPEVIAPSAGGVPAFGERNQRPFQLIVVGGRWRIERWVAQEILLRRGRDCRSHGIQQHVEFSFAHRALPGSSA
jgi:hypothetical protein